MRTLLFLSIIISISSTELNAQDLTVPDSILAEVHTVKIPVDTASKVSVFFKVIYPTNYDSTKTYPVFLGLSGGNQSEAIVNYCYAAWFRSSYFNQHITILPINTIGKNLMHYSPEDIKFLLNTIKAHFNVSAANWIIAGTSNGGRATFNFIAQEPKLYQGGIVIPGFAEDSLEINKSWKQLTLILAYGDKDEKDWIDAAEKTKNKLSKCVKHIQTVALDGQGHILSIDYDIDSVYKHYFDSVKRL